MSGEARAATELREQTLHTIFSSFFLFLFFKLQKEDYDSAAFLEYD